MVRIGGRSFEEEMLVAQCSGDEERERKLSLVNDCLGRLGWDVSLGEGFLEGIRLGKDGRIGVSEKILSFED